MRDPVDIDAELAGLDQVARFRLFADAHGLDRARREDVVGHIGPFLDRALVAMRARAASGLEAYVRAWEGGYPDQNRRSRPGSTRTPPTSSADLQTAQRANGALDERIRSPSGSSVRSRRPRATAQPRGERDPAAGAWFTRPASGEGRGGVARDGRAIDPSAAIFTVPQPVPWATIRVSGRPREGGAASRSTQPLEPTRLEPTVSSDPPAKFFVNQGVVTSRTDMLTPAAPAAQADRLLPLPARSRGRRARDRLGGADRRRPARHLDLLHADRDHPQHRLVRAPRVRDAARPAARLHPRPGRRAGGRRVRARRSDERRRRRSRRASSRSTPAGSSRWSCSASTPARTSSRTGVAGGAAGVTAAAFARRPHGSRERRVPRPSGRRAERQEGRSE